MKYLSIKRITLFIIHHLLAKLLAFALLHFVFQRQTCLLLQVSLDFFCISVPYWCFWCQFQKVLQVIKESFKFNFSSINGLGIGLDYCDVEWFALEMNRDHSVVFEVAPKCCISDSFVDYEGYSFSSKGLLPTVVDTMVI